MLGDEDSTYRGWVIRTILLINAVSSHTMPPRAKPKTAAAQGGQQDGSTGTKAAPKAKGKSRAKAGEGDDDGGASAKGLSEEKLPLPAWLKMFTERGVDMRLAMTLAAKL